MLAITGATGHLGKLVIADLIKRETAPNKIIAVVRDKAKAADLIAKGVDVRVADYKSPESLTKAFIGVERVLLISGTDLGQRLAQHTNVVNAAKAAKVKFIAYTSILNAGSSKMILADEHLATEKLISASGLPHAFLRNSWYIENYTEQLQNFLQHGAIEGSAKSGRVSVASRADYASAAAAVLLSDKVENKTYELAGSSFTLDELARMISKAKGKDVTYRDIPASEYAAKLKSFGLPAPIAEMLADSDLGIERGDLFSESRDLETLIGHKPTRMEVALG